MMHGILIGVCIIHIIALIIFKDYFCISGWACCFLMTVSDLYKTREIKSLKESISILRKSSISSLIYKNSTEE